MRQSTEEILAIAARDLADREGAEQGLIKQLPKAT
jgi:hypothetical protein